MLLAMPHVRDVQGQKLLNAFHAIQELLCMTAHVPAPAILIFPGNVMCVHLIV